MRFVVFAEQQRRQVSGPAAAVDGSQLFLQQRLQKQLLLQPHGHRHHERLKTTGREGEIRLEQPLELHEWLVIEDDVTNVVE